MKKSSDFSLTYSRISPILLVIILSCILNNAVVEHEGPATDGQWVSFGVASFFILYCIYLSIFPYKLIRCSSQGLTIPVNSELIPWSCVTGICLNKMEPGKPEQHGEILKNYKIPGVQITFDESVKFSKISKNHFLAYALGERTYVFSTRATFRKADTTVKILTAHWQAWK
ncbi:MAG: hypothetical protein HRT89_13810, partial [Lentisphaeria bacterium]|nr:hypothetical protein [Lentisphaeria bacterium]NQZ69132.1 hypothetical protein [Lentisphaeria bacterium]